MLDNFNNSDWDLMASELCFCLWPTHFIVSSNHFWLVLLQSRGAECGACAKKWKSRNSVRHDICVTLPGTRKKKIKSPACMLFYKTQHIYFFRFYTFIHGHRDLTIFSVDEILRFNYYCSCIKVRASVEIRYQGIS